MTNGSGGAPSPSADALAGAVRPPAPPPPNASQALVVIAGQLLARGTTFVLVLLAGRVMSAEEFGILNLVLILNGLCLAGALFGFDTLLLRELTVGSEEGAPSSLDVIRAKRAIWAVGGAVSMVAVVAMTPASFWVPAALIIGAAHWAATAETHETRLAHRRRYASRSAVQAVPYVALLALMVPVLTTSDRGNHTAWGFWLLAASLLVREVVRERWGARLANAGQPAARVGMRSLLARSSPFAAVGLLAFLYARVDSLMIASYLGEDDLAGYAAAYNLYTGLILVMSALSPMLMQRASPMVSSARQALVDITLAGFLGVALGVCVGVTSDQIIEIAYADKYPGSSDLLRILAIGLGLNYANSVALRRCYMVGSERWVPPILLVGLSVAIGGNLALLPTMGVSGAAWVTVCAELVLLCGFLWMLTRRPDVVGGVR